ncbi:hypothetical protein SCB49_06682 [unidentified eubacterium SCB49]|nr:hypothetical protein SCB49_06682 [unidentified eubacterium SCB49]
MKTTQLKSAIAMLFAFVFFTSCIKDDEFEVPDTTVTEVDIDGTIIDIDDLYDTWAQNLATTQEDTFTFEKTDLYISGYVISSDESGNFFEEIVVQNKAENPTRGVRILIDVNPLFTKYEIGRKLFIKLEGLTVGLLSNGSLTLGLKEATNTVEKIPAAQEEAYLIRGLEVSRIFPTIKTLSQISEADTNTLIQLPAAQFTASQIELSYANEETDLFDGDRLVESCSMDGGSILFQTSTYSDFKAINLPDGSGTLTAILAKDFFGENFALSIRDTDDIVFEGTRCEPTLLDPNISATTTFSAVIDRYNATGAYAEFSLVEEELIIEGYVVSSDEDGNYFEELVIQNTIDSLDISPNNPRLGLRVALDRADLYQSLPIGRKVYIKLNGLAVDMYAGNITIGYPNVSEIVKLPDGVIDNFIFPGNSIVDITPKVTTVYNFSVNDLNTLIQLDNMQFNVNQLDLTFAGEASDSFDGERTLESCDQTGDIKLFTSTYADFKSLIIPDGVGSITAIFTNEYYGEQRVLEIRSPDDIQFTNPERCDPLIVDCGIADTEGEHIVYAEDFETQTTGTPITGNGMVNYQEEGTQPWETFSSTSSNGSIGITAEISANNSGDQLTISWLALPEIDYDAQEGETLRFVTSNSFSDGSTLEILFSSDWDGIDTNIPNATWAMMPAAIIVPDSAYFGDYIDSGIIDLSCIEGTGHIAFKYVGQDVEEFDGTYELDEIEIRSN